MLTLGGVAAGWLVAEARQASVSDAVVAAVLTGIFTLLGVGLGLLVPLIQDWERNRPDLKLQLSYRCLHASPTGVRMASELFPSDFRNGPPLMYTWIRCDPGDAAASLFLFLDLQAQNRGFLDDALTTIQIEVPSASGISHLSVRLVDGTQFAGESIPSHQLRSLKLRLMLDRDNYAGTPSWIPDANVVWKLVATTINGQTIQCDIRPAGHFLAFETKAVEELDEWRS